MRHAIVTLSAFAIAACSPAESDHADVAASDEQALHAGPSGGSGEDAGPVPNGPASIPISLWGVWDYAQGTCAPESDLRLEIAEDSITFYESFGQVREVEELDQGAAKLTLAMQGEGEEWTQVLILRPIEAGTGLLIIDPDRPEAAEDLPRKRCS